ncbi:MAG: molecular chaperone [Gammaproteobacteria bacterium]|nr:molecular chaperone [Gammaproteobacteria bacterium]
MNQSQAIPSSHYEADGGLTPEIVLDEEQQRRAGVYGLLARLLRAAPDDALLKQLSALKDMRQDGSELGLAMSMLGLSASACSEEPVDDEYHNLFIGLGCGELLPYGSWYLTGFLMEKPLGYLRDDLSSLGFERDESVSEPEDHIAALCEVMAMLINDGFDLETQADFFKTHMEGWVSHFFVDLGGANAAIFYKSVGRFGCAFSEFEKAYLSMTV